MVHLENDLSILSEPARAALDRKPSHLIDGEWHAANTSHPVLDPSSGKQISAIGKGGVAEIDAAVQAAHRALGNATWKQLGPFGRERLLSRLADLIDEHTHTLAELETVDNGMPIWLSSGINVPGSAGVFRYFAGWPSKLVGQTMDVSGPPDGGRYTGITRREPIGVVAAIVPWNVPLMLAAWKLAPALAAGCTVVLKPAEDASLSALMLGQLVQKAGFPPGVVNIVTGLGAEAGEALVRHPLVAKISFTGSTSVGRHIGAIAGESLKKATLELGGKSPTLVFADASLEAAVKGAADAIYFNSGQVCVAGSRLYVQNSIYDEVVERLHQHVRTLSVGPGLDANSAMGPLINARQRQHVLGYIDAARNAGYDIAGGDGFEGASGFYVGPTVVTGAPLNASITQEEVFGPVLSVYGFDDEQEAIALANATDYGLAACLWSGSVDTVVRVSAALQCGKVSVNNSGFPYPALPEGGVKASGIGRDLGSEAVEQCLQTKTLMIRTQGE
ncbi:aldehyde dehydrogenase family protein [Paraburkholderia acidiphila]|uniref:Aldehyde dehydrogenase family protein n=1 Tax=Paraburkholderia acidiphila TaxID=2571747 RepID=A0A7Z2JBH9_9BURK|nr:aldehyde dehydrogenase family protein [Paraburkholderia acidiphila]QGZ56885.1 aldehyde dehydrogenase family protein [Paraburkholderia acidiphila]